MKAWFAIFFDVPVILMIRTSKPIFGNGPYVGNFGLMLAENHPQKWLRPSSYLSMTVLVAYA
jgi:hypothetical protein